MAKFKPSQRAVLAAAALINKDPELNPYVSGASIFFFTYSMDSFKDVRRRVGGLWVKTTNSEGLILTQEIPFGDEGETATVELRPPGGTCKKVAVGTEKRLVKKLVTEAVPAIYEDAEEEVAVYEFQCPDLLAPEEEPEVEPEPEPEAEPTEPEPAEAAATEEEIRGSFIGKALADRASTQDGAKDEEAP